MDLLEVQRNLGHCSILTTVKYTHLTEVTADNASERINAIMDGFCILWGTVK